MAHELPVVIYTCCRDWPCLPFVPVRRCGLCKQVPVRKEETRGQ